MDVRIELSDERAISSKPGTVSIFVDGILEETVVAFIEPETGADSGRYPVIKFRKIDKDLPEEVVTEFCAILREFQSLCQEDHARHCEAGGCIACKIRLSDLPKALTYGMMLRHWQLVETRLYTCDHCGRGYPQAEYGRADMKGRLSCRQCNKKTTTA